MGSNIELKMKPISSHTLQAAVSISSKTIDKIYKKAVSIYADYVQPYGLKNITLPYNFVEEEHTNEIKNNIKRFILKHVIVDFLLDQITNKKITIANHPRLKKMNFLPNGNIEYIFDLSIATQLQLKEWKLFTFKAPKRKRYKDLDKQVILFMKREHEKQKKQLCNIIENNDWVNFETIIINKDKEPIIPTHKASYWMKINITHIQKPFQVQFVGKGEGYSFVSHTIPMHEEFQDSLTDNCNFLIRIKSVAKGLFLSVDALKTIFKLKNKIEVHDKLIEVFSYRNDISQRKSIIEEVFHLFFSKHRFEVPKHLTIRKQEALLEMLKKQPDYQVYKAQKDFDEKVTLLAEKLLKEEILIDQIAYKENIKVESKDVRHYLTLFNNNRLREFVYFKPTFEPLEESDIPFSESYLKQAVLREKTLNHVIHSLAQ